MTRYLVSILFIAVIWGSSAPVSARTPGAWYKYISLGNNASIEGLKPVFDGTWTMKTRCKAAKQAVANSLKSLDIYKGFTLKCNADRADLTMDKKYKERLQRILPAVYYTLNWYGFKDIRLPGLHPEPVSTMELSAFALVPVMPFWAVLPPAPPIPGRVLLESGKQMDALEFRKDLNAGKAYAVHAIEEGLKTLDETGKLAIILALPNVKGIRITRVIAPLVSDPSKDVRLAVTNLLIKQKNSTSNKALQEIAQKDQSIELRVLAAKELGRRGIHKFDNIAALQEINSTDPKVAIHAIDVLLAHPVKGIGPVLLKAVGSPSQKVASKALDALIQLKQINELVSILQNQDITDDMKLISARYLANVEDENARQKGLHYLLTHGTDKDRDLALKQVQKFKDSKLQPALLQLLSGNKPKLVPLVLDTIVSLGDSNVIRPLINMAKGALADKIKAAVVRLIALQGVDKVLKMAADPNPLIRAIAVKVLGQNLKGRSQIPPKIAKVLARALKDSNKDVRIQAAAALAQSNDMKQLKQLRALSSDSDPDLRVVACKAASKLGDKSSIAILMAALNDMDDNVKIAALQGVQKLKLRQTLPTLVTMGNYQNVQVRRLVFKALISMLNPGEALKYSDFLIHGLTDRDKGIKLACLKALKGLKNRNVISAVADIKIDQDPDVRLMAVKVLSAAGTPDAVDALENMATLDADTRVRVAAIKALADLNQPDLVGFLKEMIKQEQEQGGNKAVIKAAKAILDRLTR